MTRRTLTPALLLAAAAMTAPVSLGAQASPTPQSAPAAAPAKPPAPAVDESRRVQPADIDAMLAKGDVVVLDVREDSELVETGTVKGAIHIPLGQLEARLGELPKDKVILTACRGGGRASRALTLLESKGFKTAGFCGLANYSGARVFPKAKS
ncbi:MAG: rhodanese-like domain-containing protein [Vicinamibacteria bacterium]|jgi:rhodanese-related sulfurtransferase